MKSVCPPTNYPARQASQCNQDEYADAINILGNKDEYVFNIISAPGLIYQHHSTQLDSIISLAETRGDCIAVVDLQNYGATVANVTSTAANLNSSYAAAYWPWVQVATATGKNAFVPPSVVVPGVYAFTDSSSAPWFAPAGLVRGGITGVIQAERKVSKAQRDSLYDGNVNPIATFPGSGIAVFGQKTLNANTSALDRINVARLVVYIRERLDDIVKPFLFEPNDESTRANAKAVVDRFLSNLVVQRGLYDFVTVCDTTNNTPARIDRNELHIDVAIQPVKAIEFIYIPIRVQNTLGQTN